MEAIELHEAAACHQHDHGRERHRVHVVERQRRDHAFGIGADAAHAVERGIPLAGSQKVRVAQDAALGPARGARGVEQAAFGVGADGLAGARRGGLRGRHGVVGAHGLEGHASLRGGSLQVGGALGQRDGQADLAVADEVDQLGRAHLGVDRHHARAQRVQRQPMEDEGGPVLQQQADAVAVAVAGLRVGGAQPLDLRGGFAPADGAGGDAVGGGGHRFGEEEFGLRGARGRGGEHLVDGGVGHRVLR
ncbi:hypothetical protein D9M68_748420 [compost metagenome]